MRRKATAKKASPVGTQENFIITARENTHLKVIKLIGRPTKTPTGKGLGKAGAKRLGRLLKRAIQDKEEPAATGQVSLPKTPVRLFKHQIQTETDNATKTNAAKPVSAHVSQLILSVVSQCKHRGGISMAELKQTLAAGGYNVTKNNRRVNVVTQRLVNSETLVRTTRSSSFRLNNKVDTKQVRTRAVTSPKPKGDLKQSKTASKLPKGAGESQRPARKTPKPKSKSHKPKGKTRRPAAKSTKLKGKTRRQAAKSHKLTGKTRKPAAKSHKPRRAAPKARRRSPKPAGKKRRSATNRAARVRKAPRKAQRALRRQPKQTRHPYKSSRKRQPARRRLPKTRSSLKTQRRQVTRRGNYYY